MRPCPQPESSGLRRTRRSSSHQDGRSTLWKNYLLVAQSNPRQHNQSMCRPRSLQLTLTSSFGVSVFLLSLGFPVIPKWPTHDPEIGLTATTLYVASSVPT